MAPSVHRSRETLMAARRKLRGSIGFAIVSWLGFVSCTLTSDPYDPLEASAPLQPGAAGASAVMDAGAASPPSGPSPSLPEPSCTSANEVAGCEVELLPGVCSTDADCESRNCRDGSCQPATCADGRLNQNESAQ